MGSRCGGHHPKSRGHRAVNTAAAEREWPRVSYSVVRCIVIGLDRGLLALAHGDAQEYQFEVVPIEVRIMVGQRHQTAVETLHDSADRLIRRSRPAPAGRYLGYRPVYLCDARRRTPQRQTLDQLDQLFLDPATTPISPR